MAGIFKELFRHSLARALPSSGSRPIAWTRQGQPLSASNAARGFLTNLVPPKESSTREEQDDTVSYYEEESGPEPKTEEELRAVVIGHGKPHLVEQYMSIDNMSKQELHKVAMEQIRKNFETHEFDSGSSQVQVALLTYKIQYMTEHLRNHGKDKHGRKGLHGMLMRRQKLLKYMRRKEQDAYQDVLLRLGLKDRTFIESNYV
ncbi:hypothetical protein CYMTET_48222 [Cymbomonas tetramitiformis]|uniref:Small ribosomal subunit protein uS15c n=1 Tax=Cymbomonas tetramitiformis TaxID=36881 RepID=A0AAE0EVY4_9CHLO|nr:hypothetical protein CYMTET_48222 [Cymbomonas tetramitiformis]